MVNAHSASRVHLSASVWILASIVGLIVVNLFAQIVLRGVGFDLTQGQLHKLSRGSLSVIDGIEEPIRLRFYYSPRLGREVPSYGLLAQRVQDTLFSYRDQAQGQILIETIAPEPFSDEEDHALAAGLQGVPLDTIGEKVYFGLVGYDSTDRREIIPFFQPDREGLLEYDLTKLILALSRSSKPELGLISTLPIAGGFAPGTGMNPAWPIYEQLEAFFNIRDLGADLASVPETVEVLMIVHPQELPPQSIYAIDQFVLRGRPALVFLDPHAETTASRGPAMPHSAPSSDLQDLLAAWGVRYNPDRIVLDARHARLVQSGMGIDSRPVRYLAWLALDSRNFDQNIPALADIDRINIATSGSLYPRPESSSSFIPLIRSSGESSLTEAGALRIDPQPEDLLSNFSPKNESLVLAAKVQGRFLTAFSKGPPKSDHEDDQLSTPKAGHDALSSKLPPSSDKESDSPQASIQSHLNQSLEPSTLILFADSDLLDHRFWAQIHDFFGQNLMIPLSDNADLVINLTESLLGSEALLSLRARGVTARPFVLIENLRRNAEIRFRAQEKQLAARLEEVEGQLSGLRGQNNETALPSLEQRKLIEAFTEEVLELRKSLRKVRHDLKRAISVTESRIEWFNILFMPALVAIVAIIVLNFRLRRRKQPILQG